MLNRSKVLVVAAHPDDEVLGCGGTIARLTAQHEAHIVILGEDVTARYPRRQRAPRSALRRLRQQGQAAAALLGARSIRFAGLPDNRFDKIPLLDLIKRIERWLEVLRPTIIYTHHPGDLNIDHSLTFRAVLTATRPTPGCSVREVYAFHVPSSTEWAFQRLEPVFRPNVFVDISGTLKRKLNALQRYTGEVRSAPHPRSPQALEAIAAQWGSAVGVQYAEAFELIRLVR